MNLKKNLALLLSKHQIYAQKYKPLAGTVKFFHQHSDNTHHYWKEDI